MTTQELKDYLNRAKDLEAAIYTQRELIVSYKNYTESNKPQKPNLRNISFNLVQPVYPERKERSASDDNMMVLMGMFVAVFVIMALGAIYNGSILLLVISVIGAVMCGFLSYLSKSMAESNKEYNSRIEEYKKDLVHYKELKTKWENESVQEKEQFERALIEYEDNLQLYNDTHNAKIEQYTKTLNLLTQTLQTHYESKIIFEKYRNFTAVTTMSEYLQSGRCSTLGGADGAYNMYEMELRQSVVIGQLSAIVSNLDQIKSNQYTLYQEIMRANQTVAELMSEIKDMNSTAKETAYFAEITALAAVSPEVSFGYII